MTMENETGKSGGRTYAVVTGACSGIGYCFARELAARGYAVVAVSNREREIREAAERIAGECGAEVRPLCLDLSLPEAAGTLFGFCRGMEVEVLVNNAGVFSFRGLDGGSLPLAGTMIGLHVATVTELTVRFAEEMKRRGKGYILNSSSLAGYFAFPGIALYSATKGYVRLFSESLWYEYRPFGVRITSLCPGAVATGLYGLSPSYRRMGVRLGIICRPEKMVKKALRALFRGRRVCVPYPWVNRPVKGVVRLLPSAWIAFFYRKVERFQK